MLFKILLLTTWGRDDSRVGPVVERWETDPADYKLMTKHYKLNELKIAFLVKPIWTSQTENLIEH